jgi:hypothetical protein
MSRNPQHSPFTSHAGTAPGTRMSPTHQALPDNMSYFHAPQSPPQKPPATADPYREVYMLFLLQLSTHAETHPHLQTLCKEQAQLLAQASGQSATQWNEALRETKRRTRDCYKQKFKAKILDFKACLTQMKQREEHSQQVLEETDEILRQVQDDKE